ncbi:hypothetical protein [Aurantiacibacter rhizosphaerae]|uniref:hypothetical protein n=1 Tax=Aurantiacibacter rhizosphaerae TaxID=2691582 RepID=UPI0013656767|nr:hypothetical protein [Aurantiacibacter rhizosphaerae]
MIVQNHGALVGWTSRITDERFILTIENFQIQDKKQRVEPEVFTLTMTNQQAALLGNYLLEKSGQSRVPESERTWFRRMFG